MDTTSRPQWGKPELIILVRTKPEEAVLTVCKHPGGPATSATGDNNGCQYQENCTGASNS